MASFPALIAGEMNLHRNVSFYIATKGTRLYTYGSGTLVQVYSPNGTLVDHWTQLFGTFNNGIGYTDANNATNLVAYEDPHNPYSPTLYTNRNPANSQMIAATYDGFGNTLTTQASCNGGIAQTNYQYDYTTFGLGMLTSVQQVGMASAVQYTYYPNGLVQSVTLPKAGAGPAVGAPAATVTYYYTALGNVSMVTKPGPNSNGQLVSYRYNYVYDPLGPTRQAEALGQPLTVTGPDGAITHYRYDTHGNCVTIIDAMNHQTDFRYNPADQLVSTLLPATGQTGTGRAHIDITYQYVGGPAIKTQAFDESNNPVRQAALTSGKEGETLAQTGNTEQASFTYDAAQRLSTLKDGNGHGFGHAYDAVGNLNQLTYPDGNSLRGQFDLDGNLTQFTNARGQNMRTTLVPNDSLPQSVLHDDGHSEQYVYDPFGRTTEVRDGNTTLDYTFDDLRNVLSATTTYANVPVAFTITYGYNTDGSRAFAHFSGGGGVTYLYDLCGRLTDVYNAVVANGVYHYDYDLLGHLIHKKTPATETYYSFNAAGQLVGMTNYDGAQNVTSDYSSLRYDGAGNLLSMTVKVLPVTPPVGAGAASAGVGTISYTYDSQDHLTGEQSVRNITTPLYPGQDLLAFNNPVASDAADNLTQLRGVTFSGNANNQVTTDSNGAAYGYDADGNATTEEGVQLQYDDAGHLTAYDDNTNNLHFTFGYRPDGLRAWKASQGGPPIYFFYDGDQLIAEKSTTGTWQRWYGWGAAGLEQTGYPNSNNLSETFYAFDPQGNLVNRFSSTGVMDLVCYDAFGDGIADLAYNGWIYPSDPVGWGGQWGAYTDVTGWSGASPLTGAERAGLILLTHRYYNPDTGRFLTRDPIGYEGGVNVYAYTRNNPVMHSDPSGFDGDGDDDEISDDVMTHYGTKGANAPFLHAIHTGAQGGIAVLNTAASFNPICNTLTVASGTNAEGKKVGVAGRGWAAAAIIPWGKIAEGFVNGGKWLSRFFEIKTMPVVSAQTALRSEATVQNAMKLMEAGKFPYAEQPITGFIYKGTKYIEEGNHRMSAAIRIYMKTGNRAPMQALLDQGLFEYVDHVPPGASSRFTRFPLRVEK